MGHEAVHGSRGSAWVTRQCMGHETVHGSRGSAWVTWVTRQCMGHEAMHGSHSLSNNALLCVPGTCRDMF